MESAVDWSILKGTMGAKGIPMDCDGMAQRGREFIVFEQKYHIGAQLSMGQRICLEALVKVNDNFTVVIIYGPVTAPQRIEVWATGNIQYTFEREKDVPEGKTSKMVAVLRTISKTWYTAADSRIKPDFAKLHKRWVEYCSSLTQREV